MESEPGDRSAFELKMLYFEWRKELSDHLHSHPRQPCTQQCQVPERAYIEQLLAILHFGQMDGLATDFPLPSEASSWLTPLLAPEHAIKRKVLSGTLKIQHRVWLEAQAATLLYDQVRYLQRSGYTLDRAQTLLKTLSLNPCLRASQWFSFRSQGGLSTRQTGKLLAQLKEAQRSGRISSEPRLQNLWSFPPSVDDQSFRELVVAAISRVEQHRLWLKSQPKQLPLKVP